MPRKYARNPKRRRYPKRRRAKRKPYTTKVKTVGPLPPRIITKLRYSATFTSGLVLYDSQFRLNSLFDPDYTGAGHQPYGFDSYASIYSKYRVFACKYRIKAVTSNATPCQITVVTNNSQTAFSNPSLAAESPRSVSQLLGLGIPKVIKANSYLPAVVGASKTQYKSDDRYSSDVGSSPTEHINLHIITSDMAGATTNNVSYTVELCYCVEFYDPYVLAQS